MLDWPSSSSSEKPASIAVHADKDTASAAARDILSINRLEANGDAGGKCRAWACQSASSSKHHAALLLQKKLGENGTDMGPWCAMDQTKHAKLLPGTPSTLAMRLEPGKKPQQHVMQSQSSSRKSEHQGIRLAETA